MKKMTLSSEDRAKIQAAHASLTAALEARQAGESAIFTAEAEIARLRPLIAAVETGDGDLTDSIMSLHLQNKEKLHLLEKRLAIAIPKLDQLEKDLLEALSSAFTVQCGALAPELAALIEHICKTIAPFFGGQSHHYALRADDVEKFDQFLTRQTANWRNFGASSYSVKTLEDLDLILAGKNPVFAGENDSQT